MAEKIVVIGSNSFSGASFVDYVLAEGCQVIGMSRSDEPDPAFLPYHQRRDEGFQFRRCDLNHDLDAMIEVIVNERPDFVFNFAAQSMVAQSWENPDHWFMTNTVSTVNLHDRLRTCASLQRYIHISTPEVYGSCSGYIDESTAFNPSTPYAVSRAAADMSLKTFVDAYDFPAVTTRAANVYGPGQQLYRIIPRTIMSIKMGQRLPLQGGGESTRSFIHIRDVSDATLRIARGGESGGTYHIATTSTIRIRDLVHLICDTLDVDFDDHVEEVPGRVGHDAAYLLDSTKLREQLDWSDQVSLEEGIGDTIRWVNENFDSLKTQCFDYVHKP